MRERDQAALHHSLDSQQVGGEGLGRDGRLQERDLGGVRGGCEERDSDGPRDEVCGGDPPPPGLQTTGQERDGQEDRVPGEGGAGVCAGDHEQVWLSQIQSL